MRRDQQFDMSPEPFETNMGYNPEFLHAVRVKRREEALEREKIEAEERAAERDRRRKEMVEVLARKEREEERRKAHESYRTITVREVECPAHKMPVKDIIATVADRHGVFPGEVTGASRNRKVVRTRYEAIAAVKASKPHLSLVQIGKFFNRDHATIIYALRKMGVA